jgi:hypothetical protein
MAIFARRIIQQMINENADFLTKEQVDQHVSRLNRKDFQALETEWEVAVLNVFSKIGTIQYEPNLEGTSKLDLLFIHSQDRAQFVADIATVSDEKFENETSVKSFEIELNRRIKKAGLRRNYFRYSIEAHSSTDVRPKPMIPPRKDFSQEIFNQQFKAFLKAVKQNPDEAFTHQISTANTKVLIEYNPGQQFTSGGYYVYTQAISKTQNTLYNALRAKARKQFKKISYSGPKGIIICDGGSDMFHAQPSGTFRPYFNASEVIKEFLRQNQSIDFVLTVSSVFIESGRAKINRRRPFRKIKVELFPNTNFGNIPTSIKNSIAELERYFPGPFNTADGARETIRHRFDPIMFRPLMGGLSMSEKEIKVSADSVLALLAGVITQKEFFKALKFKPWDKSSSSTHNLFEYFLKRGMRIIEIRVDDVQDYSYLIFKFGEPDAAISAFINFKANMRKDQ